MLDNKISTRLQSCSKYLFLKINEPFFLRKRNTWSSFASDKLLWYPSINYNFNNLQIVYCIFQVEHEGKFVMKWSAFFLASKYNFQLTTVKYKSARFNFSFQKIQEPIKLVTKYLQSLSYEINIFYLWYKH